MVDPDLTDSRDRARSRRLDAVIFDWGGTLTPWHELDLLECWAAVTGDMAAAAALHAAENAVWARSRDEHVSGSLDDVLKLAGSTLDEDQRVRYYGWWEQHTFIDPEAPAMLAGLRERGLKTGVLSNTLWPAAEHERIFRRDGVAHLFDGAVYSSEIDYSKPHPEAFQAALASVAVSDPTRAVYVGDRLVDDIFGAQQIGMATIHLPHSNIPAWQTRGVAGTPDAVIASLADLLAVVDGWQADRTLLRYRGAQPSGSRD